MFTSRGSPGMICQWSNTHWGKACPPVLERRSAVKPKMKIIDYLSYLLHHSEWKFNSSINSDKVKNFYHGLSDRFPLNCIIKKWTVLIKKLVAYQRTRWQASRPWRRTLEFRGSEPPRKRVLSFCSILRRYLQLRSRGTRVTD